MLEMCGIRQVGKSPQPATRSVDVWETVSAAVDAVGVHVVVDVLGFGVPLEDPVAGVGVWVAVDSGGGVRAVDSVVEVLGVGVPLEQPAVGGGGVREAVV